jgi:dTMP kinase
MQGIFIVIEGPDGAGTTLHTRLLAERLTAAGRSVLLTAEPTSGPVGTLIRSVLKGNERLPSSALQILFTADRAWHVEHVITPALLEGKIVISDRYAASTIAYGTALGLSEDWLKSMNNIFVQPTIQLFTLPPLQTCLERLAKRPERDILEERGLQERIHEAYHRLATLGNIAVVDTSGDKQQTAQNIWDIVSPLL